MSKSTHPVTNSHLYKMERIRLAERIKSNELLKQLKIVHAKLGGKMNLAASDIWISFMWSDAPQGANFWSNLDSGKPE